MSGWAFSDELLGGVLGAAVAAGLLMVVLAVRAVRSPRLADRVLPYVRDVVPGYRTPSGALGDLARALLHRTARRLDDLLGGATSVARRLDRAGLDLSVHDFRVVQVMWGLVGLTAAGALTLVVALRDPGRTPPMLVLCAVAAVLGALLRENRLSAQATARDRLVLAELPVVVELVALAVAAGEGPTAAIERTNRRCDGELARDLGRVLREVRTGTPLARALDAYAARSQLPAVARFAQTVAVAVERGTPLTDVLHAQARDAREAGRRQLIESGARREIAMMVP